MVGFRMKLNNAPTFQNLPFWVNLAKLLKGVQFKVYGELMVKVHIFYFQKVLALLWWWVAPWVLLSCSHFDLSISCKFGCSHRHAFLIIFLLVSYSNLRLKILDLFSTMLPRRNIFLYSSKSPSFTFLDACEYHLWFKIILDYWYNTSIVLGICDAWLI